MSLQHSVSPPPGMLRYWQEHRPSKDGGSTRVVPIEKRDDDSEVDGRKKDH